MQKDKSFNITITVGFLQITNWKLWRWFYFYRYVCFTHKNENVYTSLYNFAT